MTRKIVQNLPELLESVRAQAPEMSLTEGADMARYTTLRLGGPADVLAEPRTPAELQMLLRESSRLNIPVTLIGQGSNLLVRDGGIRGLVIRVAGSFRGVTVQGTDMTVLAGTSMGAAASAAAEHDLAGLTFASGIPGTVGGGVYMNAGAYGGEMKHQLCRGGAGLWASPQRLAGSRCGGAHGAFPPDAGRWRGPSRGSGGAEPSARGKAAPELS